MKRRNEKLSRNDETFGKPLPANKQDERVSRTLSRILRHQAINEGVAMRSDGYVKVSDLVSLGVGKLHSVDFQTLERVVRNDNKSRYKMILEPDESNVPVWWIRANQGHSINNIQVEMKEVTDPSDIIMAVHGTTRKAWEFIRVQGLSRMNRQHIHFAQGMPKSGVLRMRTTSEIYIKLDVEAALKYGLRLLVSANDVVLSPGDVKGYIAPCFFESVLVAANKQPVKDWERPMLPPLPGTALTSDPPVEAVIEGQTAQEEHTETHNAQEVEPTLETT
ncbi:hypothetical protein M422DRAFT_151974 [Sphaerobolus stellatus SS14]|nr:hypothetical protein M422DRAFT_151974 [Sphaerobolus stellatus SS14]